MKTLFRALLFVVLFAPALRAQYVTIPDPNFQTWLQTNYPACMGTGPNVGMLDTTCADILTTYEIIMGSGFIPNIEGIKYFKNCTHLYCGEIGLTSLPELPMNLYHLDVSLNSLTSIPSNLPSSLVILRCNFNGITSLPSNFSTIVPNLVMLKCGDNNISYLPTLPPNLAELECNGNQMLDIGSSLPSTLQLLNCNSNNLTTLPNLSNTQLTELTCTNNSLTSLPPLPTTLLTIHAEDNQISSLPTLVNLNSLYMFICFDNQITSLPALPTSLNTLNCSYNQITSLPALPTILGNLECQGNQLTSLPTIPSGMYNLDCSDNALTVLPTLPSGLMDLFCSDNALTVLPTLPSALRYFDCSDNALSALPTLPSGMLTLNCSDNPLTILPTLPSGLLSIICTDNQLTTLPPLPNTLNILKCDSNLLLSCLPTLPSGLHTLHTLATGITCLPNHPASLTTGLVPNTLTVCNAGNNPNGCNTLPYVQGTAFNDANINAVWNAGESFPTGLVVQAQPGGYMGSVSASGQYIVTADSVTPYTVTIPSLPLYYTTVPASHTGTLPGVNSFHTGKDFALQPIPNVNDLRVTLSASTPPRPGFSQTLYMAYRNVGTAAQNAVLTLQHSDTLLFANATPPPTTTVGNTLTWNLGTLAPTQMGTVAVQFNVPANVALLGETLHSFASITPVATDTTPTDNHSHLAQVVVGAYDPNDKQVSPQGSVDVAAGEWLTYTVRFQNTGTAPADFVIIRDTLDADLDIATLQTVVASHPFVFSLKNRNAIWHFPNIQLPDSGSNGPASHGFVQYRVRARTNVPAGTAVTNTASIYFDFNPPIVTNTVSTVLKEFLATSFLASDTAVCGASNAITFMDTLTAPVTTRQWSAAGGMPNTGSGSTFAPVFATAGSYTISLRAETPTAVYTGQRVVVVTAGPSPSLTVTQPPCAGTSGQLLVSATGSTPPYTFSLNGGTPVPTGNFPNLPVGTYTATVEDANGCTSTVSATLTAPTAVTAQAVPGTFAGGVNVSCSGASDGSIDLTPGGGTAPYTVLWNTSQTTEDIGNLPAGTYTATVEDANGCTSTASVTLTAPTAVTAQAVPGTFVGGVNVSCSGASDGSIDLTPGGGTAPYTVLWNTTQTTEDINGLTAGIYTATVEDANGCTTTVSVALTEPAALTAFAVPNTFAGGVNVSCNGATDGSINLTGVGLAAPYTVSWSSGQTTEDISGLPAGTYTATVEDANGCTTTVATTLFEPQPLSVSLVPSNASGAAVSDGGATSSLSGGTAPYTYLWSNNDTTEHLANVLPGVYILTATDANGCTQTDTVTVDFTIGQTEAVGALTISLYPNPATGRVTVIIPETANAFEVLDATGRSVLITHIVLGNENIHLDVSAFAAGVYTVVVHTDVGSATARLVVAAH